jgi:ABC-2 type transport system ATP-binding protein
MNTTDTIIEVRGLSRRFGKKEALKDVNLSVQRGQVFGLVGENGAGKTTFIRHLLGAYEAESGTVQVFDLDPVRNPVAVLGRIGYLSEDRDLPLWMKVRELMAYTAAFYPDWDAIYAEELRKRFNLPPDAKLKQLSRGEKAKAGLLAALAHRPDLLLLDEPSSGLDAVARKDILGEVIRSVADEGRTVIFSSHLLDEVERVSDHVAMIHEGVVALDLPMDTLKETHHRIVVRLNVGCADFPEAPGVLHAEGSDKDWCLLCEGDKDRLIVQLQQSGGHVVECTVPTLDAIFVGRVTGRPMAVAASGDEG